MSDPSQAEHAHNDPELRDYAHQLWASPDYRSWRERVRQAVADGTIYDEPPLNGDSASHP